MDKLTEIEKVEVISRLEVVLENDRKKIKVIDNESVKRSWSKSCDELEVIIEKLK